MPPKKRVKYSTKYILNKYKRQQCTAFIQVDMPDIKPDIASIETALAVQNVQGAMAEKPPEQSAVGRIRIKSELDLMQLPPVELNQIANGQEECLGMPAEAPEAASCNLNMAENAIEAVSDINASSTNNGETETAATIEQTPVRVKSEPGLELDVATPAVNNNVGRTDIVEYNAGNLKLEPVVNTTSSAEEMPPPEEPSAPLAIECVAPTDISPDFFSDLIDLPETPPPLETLPMETLERKYSETLREKALLDELARQQQKRASNSTDDNAAPEKRARLTDESSSTSVPFIRVKSEFRTESDVQCLPVHIEATSKRNENIDVKCIATFNEIEDFGDKADNTEIARQIKRDVAYRRANYVLELFKKEANAPAQLIHTDTVRKLPTHTQYMSQQFYDNRSPLHSANNVQFYFNSPYTNINMEDWGLKSLSPNIAHIARIIGCDAYMLNWKQMVTKRPYLTTSNTADEEKQCATKSTFFSNIMTQTDLTGAVCKQTPKIKQSTKNTQTDPIAQPATGFLACVQNFPYLKQMAQLNANQLLALNDFAELMHQDDIAADVYRLRECLLRIFQRSQMPALDNRPVYAAPAASTNHILQPPRRSVSPPPPPSLNDLVGHYNVSQPHQMPNMQQPHQMHNMQQPHQMPNMQQSYQMHNGAPQSRNRQLWFQQETQQNTNNKRHYREPNLNTGSRHHQY